MARVAGAESCFRKELSSKSCCMCAEDRVIEREKGGLVAAGGMEMPAKVQKVPVCPVLSHLPSHACNACLAGSFYVRQCNEKEKGKSKRWHVCFCY